MTWIPNTKLLGWPNPGTDSQRESQCLVEQAISKAVWHVAPAVEFTDSFNTQNLIGTKIST